MWSAAARSRRRWTPGSRPGCRVSTASYIASMLRPEVIRDLKLGSYGLRMVACEPDGAGRVRGRRGRGLVERPRANARTSSTRLRRGTSSNSSTPSANCSVWRRSCEPFFLEPPPDVDATGWRRIRRTGAAGRALPPATGADLAGLDGVSHRLARRFPRASLQLGQTAPADPGEQPVRQARRTLSARHGDGAAVSPADGRRAPRSRDSRATSSAAWARSPRRCGARARISGVEIRTASPVASIDQSAGASAA